MTASAAIPRMKLRRAAELKVRRCEDNSLPYVGLENVESKTGRYLEGVNEMPDAVANEFVPGDVLFGKLRPYLAKSLVPDFHGRCSGELLVLQPKGLDSRFLHYWLLSDETISTVSASTYGAKMPRADWDFIGNLEIPVAPLSTQRSIATYLDRETARIDALVAEKQALLRLLEEKRASVITHAVTRGLNPKAKLKPSGIPWLGDVPVHWATKELRHIAASGTKITYGIVQAGPDQPNGVPYIRTSDMSGDTLPHEGYRRTSPEIDRAYARSRVDVDDMVVAIRATVGKTLQVPVFLKGANLTQGTAKISPGESVDARFLFHWMNSCPVQGHFKAIAKGTTFKEITLEMLRRTPILEPPLGEQRDIAAACDRWTRVFSQIKVDISASIALLREKRSSLISAAVTGEIEVA